MPTSRNLLELLNREHTIAEPGFNRWLIPPAALAVHLCIGQIYGFSVLNTPLTRLVGVTRSIPRKDWTIPEVGWIYSIGLIMLGLSAAVLGRWVERSGPRKTIVASAFCFCGGLWLTALGVHLHWLWLVYVGYGVIGGIGLGLGYISPVSTLVRWFPDRPGLATGLAIMGFGGGALLGAPLATEFIARFRTATDAGVWQTLTVMGCLYFAMMLFGAWMVRVPPAHWRPVNLPARVKPSASITPAHVPVENAWKTAAFWFLWLVLCLNVTAGIGILGQAQLMCQDMFNVSTAAATGFVGVLSLFNMAGRIVWASLSDVVGRKGIYSLFFLLGAALYASIPQIHRTGNIALYVVVTGMLISMYGGGFATIPAYLRDVFGTMHLGAIHGRLITAWSMAAVLGPQLVNYISTYQKEHKVQPASAYDLTMYLMSGLLIVGFVCNLCVRPVDSRFHHESDLHGGDLGP